MRDERPARRLTGAIGPGVALLGLTPFLVASLLWQAAPGGGLMGFGLSGKDLLLQQVGVPSAGCGASRALYHFVRGDPSFLDYNPFWVVAFLALIAYGIALTVRSIRGRPLQGRAMTRAVAVLSTRPWVAAPATLVFLSVPWAVALVNLDAIRGG